jgi:TetR/AcrR family transcriptional regulator, fatty acid metabolism regulator protein
MTSRTRRDAILAASTRLFADKGFGHATTSEIAHEAGVAEGTLYHHFGSKDEIFLTIFEETVSGYLAGAERIAAKEKSGLASLRTLIRFHFDFIERNAGRFLVILRDFPSCLAEGSQSRAAACRSRFASLTPLIAGVLARGVEDGSLRQDFPARDTAETIRGILYGTTRHRMLGIIDVPLPRLASIVESFCLRALSPAPAGVPDGGRRTGTARR